MKGGTIHIQYISYLLNSQSYSYLNSCWCFFFTCRVSSSPCPKISDLSSNCTSIQGEQGCSGFLNLTLPGSTEPYTLVVSALGNQQGLGLFKLDVIEVLQSGKRMAR